MKHTCANLRPCAIEFDNRHIFTCSFFNIDEHYRYSKYVFFTRFHFFYFWHAGVMATNDIHQRVHCFNNLVQFMTIHKFKTDWKSVARRKSFLNICLSGIDALHVKKSHLSEIFNRDKRTLNEYIYHLAVAQIKFPEPQVKKGPSWEKREGGVQLINTCKGYWGSHLTTSPNKHDLVFKHVRGDGLHTLVEINGLKEFQCNPGRYSATNA